MVSTCVLLYISLYFSVCLKYFERNKEGKREGKKERKKERGITLDVKCWTGWWPGIMQSPIPDEVHRGLDEDGAGDGFQKYFGVRLDQSCWWMAVGNEEGGGVKDEAVGGWVFHLPAPDTPAAGWHEMSCRLNKLDTGTWSSGGRYALARYRPISSALTHTFYQLWIWLISYHLTAAFI